MSPPIPDEGTLLRGQGVSPGIAVGRALVLDGSAFEVARRDLDPAAAAREVERFEAAVREAGRQLRRLRDRVRTEAGPACARVFQAQILILRDPALHRETVERILGERVNAEWAVRGVLGRYARVFDDVVDDVLRERGSDIEDVEERLVAVLTGRGRRSDLEALDEDVIVVARSLAPSDAAALARPRVVGLALDTGGPTSHTAIVAGALGIPAVVGLGRASVRVHGGEPLVLDGGAGIVRCDLPPGALETWRRLAGSARPLVEPGTAPAEAGEGAGVALMANVKVPEEVETALRLGADGIGLYRSEFLYLRAAPDLPDEEAQASVYGDLAARAAPHEVVIRTLDLGGEDHQARVLGRRESNPALGLRGIRLGLHRPDLLRTQMRAILRAGARGRVRILLPMISGADELRRARVLLEEARDDLARDAIPAAPDAPLGVMIEVPSAAILAHTLAAHADFLAIGTNDLIQYTLAIDRGNEAVAYLYQPLHPAVVDLLRRVVAAASSCGRRLSVCGEMAADPVNAVILVGLGIMELSMRPAALPAVRATLGAVGPRAARAIASEALSATSAEAIAARARELVRAALAGETPGALREIRA